MKTIPQRGRITSYRKMVRPPAIVTEATTTQESTLNLTTEKITVQSGRFQPGVYRVNPYTVWEERAYGSNSAITLTAYNAPYTYTVMLSGEISTYLNLVGRSKFTAPSYSSFEQRALLKAYNKIGASEAGMGENLGELAQTISMLKHPFKDLRNFFSDTTHNKLGLYQKLWHFAKTGKWIGKSGVMEGADAAKAAANTWLEYRYGVMPIVMTIQDLMKLVNKKVSEWDASKIRCKRAVVKNINTMTATTPNSYIGHAECKMEHTCVDSQRFYASVQYRMSGAPDLSESLGLTLPYLPETLWELTRLSFVLDWWFGVGDWLESLRFKPTVQILGNTSGVKNERTVSTQLHAAVGTLTKLGYTNLGVRAYYEKNSYVRSVNLHLPMLPVFKPEFRSVLHAIDAVALILQPTLKLLRSKR